MRHIVGIIIACAAIGCGSSTTSVSKCVSDHGLDGKWQAVSIEYKGKLETGERVTKHQMSIEGNRVTDLVNGKEETGPFKVDTSVTPSQIDFYVNEDGTEKILKAIFELKGDTLVYCRPTMANRDRRPEKFSSTHGSGYEVWTFKRVK